jgi:hypothetical protein
MVRKVRVAPAEFKTTLMAQKWKLERGGFCICVVASQPQLISSLAFTGQRSRVVFVFRLHARHKSIVMVAVRRQ